MFILALLFLLAYIYRMQTALWKEEWSVKSGWRETSLEVIEFVSQ